MLEEICLAGMLFFLYLYKSTLKTEYALSKRHSETINGAEANQQQTAKLEMEMEKKESQVL